MAQRYSPTPDERRALERLAEEVAGVQQTLELGWAITIPFSLVSSESTPRCATHTWFCASTVTPVIDPSTHESS